jgi:hypothetical protein
VSKKKRSVRSPRKSGPPKADIAVAFFDRHCFRKEVNTPGRRALWWFLRWWLKDEPWHVVVVMNGYVYEMCFWQGCIRYPTKLLARYPYRVYTVKQDAILADERPWCRGDKVTRLRATLAVLGFRGTPGTVNCATTACSLLGIEPPLTTPSELMKHLEARCQGNRK